MRRFDYIKNMTLKEMAGCDWDFFQCPYDTPYKNCEKGKLFNDDCEKCIEAWLKEEIETDKVIYQKNIRNFENIVKNYSWVKNIIKKLENN